MRLSSSTCRPANAQRQPSLTGCLAKANSLRVVRRRARHWRSNPCVALYVALYVAPPERSSPLSLCPSASRVACSCTVSGPSETWLTKLVSSLMTCVTCGRKA